MREWLAKLRDWTRRDQLDRELREELQFHQEHIERDAHSIHNVDVASDDSQARYSNARHTANRQLGNTTRIREAARELWSVPWLDNLQQDVRYAIRGLRRNPGFTLTVVLTLSLGFGVNAAIFSLLDRLFAQAPAGIANASTLKRIYVTQQHGPSDVTVRDQYNYPEWVDIRNGLGNLPCAAYATDSTRLGRGDNQTVASVTYTDAAYWSTLGVLPLVGRTFSIDEGRIEVPSDVVIISNAMWTRQFEKRKDIVGQTLSIGGNQYVIIGVAPANFTGLELGATDLWLPLGAMPMAEYGARRFWYQVRSNYRLHAVARVPENANVAPLDARVTTAFRVGSIAAGYESDSSATVAISSIIVARGPMKEGQELLISTRLAWVSLLVLIIACANVANLLLTRLLERRREIAVRLALGVSRGRLATQFLVETVALALLALGVALALGIWAGGVLRAVLLPATHWTGAVFEWRLVLALTALAFVAAVVIALVPIVHVKRFSGSDVLKSGQRTTAKGGNRLRTLLLVGQTSLAVLLLTGAALSVESLRRIMSINTGYDLNQLATARPGLPGSRGGESTGRDAEVGIGLNAVAERLSRVVGVDGVALAWHSPMGGYMSTVMRVPGFDSIPKLKGNQPALRAVSAEYWRVVGLRSVRGRVTALSDVEGAPLIVVVNETMARTVWPGRDAIGQCIELYRDSNCRTVVGVVRDTHLYLLVEESRMIMYTPLAQAGANGRALKPAALIVRALPGRLPASVVALRNLLNEMLPNADLGLTTVRETIAPQYRPWQLGALLFSALGALGLLVVAVGLYGVIAFGVRQRMPELGIRVALGAERRNIVLLVMQQGVMNVGFGLVVGMAIAIALSRFMSSMLYNTSLGDPFIVLAVAMIMVVTAIIASLVPAWKAGSVDPLVALRNE